MGQEAHRVLVCPNSAEQAPSCWLHCRLRPLAANVPLSAFNMMASTGPRSATKLRVQDSQQACLQVLRIAI